MKAKEIVSKVNELFHFQKTKDWEVKAIELVELYAQQRYLLGKMDVVLDAMAVEEDYHVKSLFEKKHEKLSRQYDELFDKINYICHNG